MKRENISTDEVVKRLGKAFETLDETRQKGLKEASEVQEIKNKSRLKEKNRLTKKYGENHPKVKKLETRIRFGDSSIKGIDREVQQADIQQPPFEPGSWRVTGRILDNEMNGVEDLTVALYDEKGVWLRDLGKACTDKKGFYSITVKDSTGEIFKKYQEKPLILTLSKGDSNIIHREEEPLYLKVNSIEYRQIILSKEQCPPPPPDPGEKTWTVRGVVMRKASRRNIPLAGAIVHILDREKRFAKLLGKSETDQKGEFKFVYDIKTLKKLMEVDPDLFVMVYDKNGERIYTSKDPIHCKAGGVEELEILI